MKTLTLVGIVFSLWAMAIVSASGAGKIVAWTDDWTLSDSGFGAPDEPGVFADNIARWFTGGGTGSFLAYSADFGLTGTQLKNAMTSAGNSWTVTTSGTLDLARMQTYDGVFLSVPYYFGISASTLTDYVNAGGNVYLYAGDGGVDSPAPWNPFLASFGLKFAPGYNPLVENVETVSSHPIFAGVDHLFVYNGNDVVDLDPANPANQVLVVYKGHALCGIYDGSLVPEASSLLALVSGLGGLGLVWHRRPRAR